MSTPLPDRIGRYQIRKLLGKGGQGVVLQAHDEELDRDVALKLLRFDEAEAGTLATEARIVSRLQHPNIVTLYDVGRYHHRHYIVFEYIEGRSLRQLIDEQGALSMEQSVILLSQILAGVAYLHENGIVHRDLTPANILLHHDAMPKVTDFGISLLQKSTDTTSGGAGTLRYMAPESFEETQPSPATDVYTLGCIFYEMLTGRPLNNGRRLTEIVREALHGGEIGAADFDGPVPDAVLRVVKRASARNAQQRYDDARAMKRELDRFRIRRDDDGDQNIDSHSTVEFLLRRMAVKKGFSSLSGHISELLEITSAESNAPQHRLVNILAKDVTLSQRVLTTANSAYYGNSDITALPRAVVLLGLDQVRMCVTQALLESEFEAGSDDLRLCLARAFHSAVLAKALAPGFGVNNRADAFTGAMFHDLGRMLAIHYFDDEYRAILAQGSTTDGDELTASRTILGVAFHELGAAVARSWKFADAIIMAMTPLPRGDIPAPADTNQALQLCCAYANAMSAMLSRDDAAADLDDLRQRVAGVTDISDEAHDAALGEAAALLAPYLRLLKLDGNANPALEGLLAPRAWRGAA